jgi:hypothetical protein
VRTSLYSLSQASRSATVGPPSARSCTAALLSSS